VCSFTFPPERVYEGKWADSLDQLHLTPVNEMAQMRPQFHHIDAHTEQERASRPRDPNFVRAPAEARTVHMTVKSTVESEDTEETIAERIKAAQDEPWKKMKYVDEDSEVAWEKFNEELFVEDAEKAERLVSVYGDEEYLDRISAPRDQARLSRARVRRKKNREDCGESDEE
jgi:DNA-directed RNA polymerase-3 subunit RPC5